MSIYAIYIVFNYGIISYIQGVLLTFSFTLLFVMPIISVISYKKIKFNTIFITYTICIIAYIILNTLFYSLRAGTVMFVIPLVYILVLMVPVLYMIQYSKFIKEKSSDLFNKVKSMKQIIFVISTLSTLDALYTFADRFFNIETFSTYYTNFQLPTFLIYIFAALLYSKIIKPVAIEEGYIAE